MNSRPELRLDWCGHDAAKYAVEHWHYSRSMPVGRLVKVGVWEDRRFIGVVLFAQGNNQHQGKAFNLSMWQVCELVRVALTSHASTVSRIISLALKFLKRFCTGIRLVISYADPLQGHIGGIYQAGNWVFVGTGGSGEAFFDQSGKRLHSRAYSPGGTKIQFGALVSVATAGTIHRVKLPRKFKYLMPLDAEVRARVERLRKPYPKRAGSDTEDTPANHAGEGGSTPTPALQSNG